MESHPLNLAHQQRRRAEAHLKYNRFDEAIECHKNAAEHLLDVVKIMEKLNKSPSQSIVLRSLNIQRDYHIKQQDIINIKKNKYETVNSVENTKCLSKD